MCATASERFDLSFNNLFAFDFVLISHAQPYGIHINKDCVTEYTRMLPNHTEFSNSYETPDDKTF